jgi:hypothetical protein
MGEFVSSKHFTHQASSAALFSAHGVEHACADFVSGLARK